MKDRELSLMRLAEKTAELALELRALGESECAEIAANFAQRVLESMSKTSDARSEASRADLRNRVRAAVATNQYTSANSVFKQVGGTRTRVLELVAEMLESGDLEHVDGVLRVGCGTTMNEFGEALRQARTNVGLTLISVASVLGVSVPYLSDVERGRRAPLAGVKLDAATSLLSAPELPRMAARSRQTLDLRDLTPEQREMVFGFAEGLRRAKR